MDLLKQILMPREPNERVAGVRGVGHRRDASQRELEALYAGSFSRLVAVVGAVCQDRSAAEEAVQEAFVRLIGQWSKVSTYEDPEAWLRKVALGYVSKGRRKSRNGLLAALRHGPPPDTPEPSGDRLDLRRAISALPRAQREVIILQDLGLSIEQIAHQVDVPAGTVKSRLSRARAALIPLLQEEIDHV